MFYHKKIRKALAVILLAIFALSNTPVKYLHDFFAGHEDFVSETLAYSDSPQLNISGIHCHCQGLVAIAPYTFENGHIAPSISRVFLSYTAFGINQMVVSESISFGLRGPPSLA